MKTSNWMELLGRAIGRETGDGAISLLRREPASHQRTSRTMPGMMTKAEFVTVRVDILRAPARNIVDPRPRLPPQGTRIEPIISSLFLKSSIFTI